jgi:hypothetical protein
MGLSEHSPARGSIMLKSENMAALLNQQAAVAARSTDSPALDRRLDFGFVVFFFFFLSRLR